MNDFNENNNYNTFYDNNTEGYNTTTNADTLSTTPQVEFPKYESKKQKKKHSILALIGVIICFTIISTLIVGSYTVIKLYDKGYIGNKTTTISNESLPEVNLNVTNKPETTDEDLQPASNGKYTTEQIAKLLKPSVVGVVTYSMQTFQELGEGTGIISTEDGYIITNAHVIKDADSVKVILSDETEYQAKIVGSDPKTDLAVLKIDANGLTPVVFGSSDEASVGEEVIAIGNAAGLSNSVTKGIISELNRDISENGYGLKAIQTDAAINPGNSGGPLVNMYGQVIGITSSKYVGTGYEGIGFAISIDEALPLIENLVSYGYITDRAEIGIECDYISESTAYMYGLKSGLYVKSIDVNSAAYNSELEVYDIITEINGTPVTSSDTASEVLSNKKPGDTIKVTVYRFANTSFGRGYASNGQTLTFDITLSEDKGKSN